jgi:hypothetical protein
VERVQKFARTYRMLFGAFPTPESADAVLKAWKSNQRVTLKDAHGDSVDLGDVDVDFAVSFEVAHLPAGDRPGAWPSANGVLPCTAPACGQRLAFAVAFFEFYQS